MNTMLTLLLFVGTLAAQTSNEWLKRAHQLQAEAQVLDDKINQLPIGDPQRKELRLQWFALLNASNDASSEGMRAALSDSRLEAATRNLQVFNAEMRAAILHRKRTRWRLRRTLGLWQ
jgi:hypothetical protein